MKVLFATKNPAKVKNYKKELEKNGIELITLNDINEEIKINENGKNALENAFIKAKTCYDILKIPCIGMDNNLFIENIPEEKQPGTYVRRINGKELNDDEMIEYYTNLVKEYGEKQEAKWIYGMVIYNGNEKRELSWSKGGFYFVSKPSLKRNPGYPLDSISIDIESGKYFVDMEKSEKEQNKDVSVDNVINFIVESIKN